MCKLALILALLTLVVTGCHVYHFEYPQPVDAVSEKAFPAEFIGIWKHSEEGEESTMTISSNKLILEDYRYIKVINRAKTAGDSLAHVDFINTINNHNGKTDTVRQYILSGSKLYKVEGDNLIGGFSYKTSGDTIFSTEGISIEILLNHYSQLKKVGAQMYILNVQEAGVPGLTKQPGPWFHPLLLRVGPNGEMSMATIDENAEEKFHLSRIFRTESDVYTDVRWKKEELLKLIEQGLFTNTSSGNFRRVSGNKRR